MTGESGEFEELATALGRRIHRRRVERRMTLRDVGGAQLTDEQLAAMEAGAASPSLKDLFAIAPRVGMTVQELIPDDVDPEMAPLDFRTMTRGELQRAHEMAVAYSAAQFLRSKGMDVRAVRPGNPQNREPDALFDSGNVDGKIGGFEITCVGYYPRESDEADLYARDLWDLAGGRYDDRDDRTIPVLKTVERALTPIRSRPFRSGIPPFRGRQS